MRRRWQWRGRWTSRVHTCRRRPEVRGERTRGSRACGWRLIDSEVLPKRTCVRYREYTVQSFSRTRPVGPDVESGRERKRESEKKKWKKTKLNSRGIDAPSSPHRGYPRSSGCVHLAFRFPHPQYANFVNYYGRLNNVVALINRFHHRRRRRRV